MEIDSSSPLPLYAQLESILAAEIASGTFPPGSQLPNEEELVERYGVSRTTIRQTIQNLVHRGLLRSGAVKTLSFYTLRLRRS